MNELCISPSTISSFIHLKKRPNAKARLFAFHHAGGCASAYHSWTKLLPTEIDLIAGQLPGRGVRFNEPFFYTIKEAVSEIVNTIPSFLDKSSFFFGHSLGAILAYEAATALVQTNSFPTALFVSGEIAPQIFYPTLQKFADSSDEEFINKILAFNGIPDAVLQDEDLFELLLPRLRADFKMSESYKYEVKKPLDIPIVVMSGQADKTINNEDLFKWQELTTKPIKIKMFPGDHFYLNQERDLVIKFLLEEIRLITNSEKLSMIL